MREYYYRPLPDRVQILSKLMGETLGRFWLANTMKLRKITPQKEVRKFSIILMDSFIMKIMTNSVVVRVL